MNIERKRNAIKIRGKRRARTAVSAREIMRMKKVLILFFLSLFVNAANGQVNRKEETAALIAASHLQLLINFSNLNQQLKSLDSPEVKIFLKIKMANFIWDKKVIGGNEQAGNLMEEAAQILQSYKNEISPLYKNSFQSD